MIADGETVLVPMLDDFDGALFSGAFVLSSERACAAVAQFLRHGSVDDCFEGLGDWHEL